MRDVHAPHQAYRSSGYFIIDGGLVVYALNVPSKASPQQVRVTWITTVERHPEGLQRWAARKLTSTEY